MSRDAVASGWCPVHDCVYERTLDGLCPDCGTELVDVDRATFVEEPPSEASAAPPRSSRIVAVAVAAAIVGAFAIGLAFPRQQKSASERAHSPTSSVALDERVGSVARSASGELRLDRLVQHRDAFTATFTAQAGFPDSQLVKGVAVEVSTVAGGAAKSFGVSDVHLSHVDGGFTVSGRLEPDSGRITEVRLSSIQTAVPTTPRWFVDVSKIWPVQGSEPAVLHVGLSRSVAPGSIRLVSVVSWHDRMEVSLELAGTGSGQTGNVAIDEIVIEQPGEGVDASGVLAAMQLQQISPTDVVARFEGLPRTMGPITIRASGLSRFLAGPWEWRIA